LSDEVKKKKKNNKIWLLALLISSIDTSKLPTEMLLVKSLTTFQKKAKSRLLGGVRDLKDWSKNAWNKVIPFVLAGLNWAGTERIDRDKKKWLSQFVVT